MQRPSQFPPGVIPYHSAGGSDQLRGKDPLHLFQRERGVRALDPPGVGVEGGVERALGGPEVAQHEVQGLGHHAEILRPSPVLPRVQVGPGQLRLVGEHLLEVGHEPAGIGGVAAEAADDVVVDAARRHGVERALRHVPGVLAVGTSATGPAQAQLHQGRPRELRRRAESAPLGIEAGTESRHDLGEAGLGVRAWLGSRASQAQPRDAAVHGLLVQGLRQA